MKTILISDEILFEIQRTGRYYILEDGEPCKHPGCFHHFSHPCEVCGRTGMQGSVLLKLKESYKEI